jgi:hypothetical protein
MRLTLHIFLAALCCLLPTLCAAAPDVIFHRGKIVTVDDQFTIHSALAVEGSRITAAGSDEEILKRKGPQTRVVDLGGKTVLPGLIDSHVHPTGAAMTEWDHPIPEMESIADVLAYIRERTKVVKPGDWIVLQQVFITRLREQRYPTRAELDAAAPEHPVLYRTGPDAMLNSLALKLSGIDRDFKVTDGGTGFIEKDPQTGEPTGVLRNCTRFVKSKSSARSATDDDKRARLAELFRDYNASGLTTICDRDSSASALDLYTKLRDSGQLTVRVMASHGVSNLAAVPTIQAQMRKIAEDPLFTARDPWVRIIGVKMYLDGGMLTGSAYMREPWGVSAMYGITDPAYRGVLFMEPDKLVPAVRTAAELGLQFTAHSVGDGAVHALLDAYETVSRERPIAATRPSITHCSFQSADAVAQAARLGVAMDIQPAWLYLDTRTLEKQFGYNRLRYFQPLRSLFAAGVTVGGGSDHMQKIGSLRSINPYNPFLGIATAVTRRAKWFDRPLHPEESLTREQAIRFYTINNARLLFLEKEVGSLEPGKRADFVILDRDILACPENELATLAPRETWIDGRQVFRADAAKE